MFFHRHDSMTISSFFLSVFSILITCVLTKNFTIQLFFTLKWSIFSFYFFREQVSAFPGLFLTINPFEIFISICLCLGELMAKLAPCSCSSLGLCPFIHHLTTSLRILRGCGLPQSIEVKADAAYSESENIPSAVASRRPCTDSVPATHLPVGRLLNDRVWENTGRTPLLYSATQLSIEKCSFTLLSLGKFIFCFIV